MGTDEPPNEILELAGEISKTSNTTESALRQKDGRHSGQSLYYVGHIVRCWSLLHDNTMDAHLGGAWKNRIAAKAEALKRPTHSISDSDGCCDRGAQSRAG